MTEQSVKVNRTTKKGGTGKTREAVLSARGRALLERIRRRREKIRRRVGILPNSADLIRQDRERRALTYDLDLPQTD